MRNKRLIAIILGIMLILIALIYFIKLKLDESFKQGPNLSYINVSLANEYMPKIDSAIRIFYYNNKKYPNFNNKYFYTQLKDYLSIDPIYIYLDSSIGSNSIMNLDDIIDWREELKISDSTLSSIKNSNKLFIAFGNSDHFIVVRKLKSSPYSIIYVGENGKDESGNGDDILYEK